MSKEQDRILTNLEAVFLPRLKETFGSNLTAVILYGSVVKETFTDGFSDANVLILLGEADPTSIVKLGKTGRSVMRKNRINPLLLTANEYLESADVFPLEYLDIADSRKVIFGDDPTGKLDITKSNLRHQVEVQLRGTVADLRRTLLASRGRNGALRKNLKGWFGSQSALLRGLLRLGGEQTIPVNFVSAVQAIGSVYKIDSAALEELAKIRGGEKIDAVQAIERALLCFSELAKKIDAMDV
ncbi:MAG: hypothetical protein HN368_00435 [Spirochaetales bacterium]|jgi:predicted nucleotidyltransferase|nr:hypothetical protein [Spirochaetales bacterium]